MRAPSAKHVPVPTSHLDETADVVDHRECASGAMQGADVEALSVSIVIPCRDERERIAACLDSILADRSDGLKKEIIVVDGRSKDGTRAVLEEYESRGSIRMIDNPKRITPVAMNLGIKAARGSMVLIMGAHAEYPPDYVTRCVRHLMESGADNVGGVLEVWPGNETLSGLVLASVVRSRFGIGVARFRTAGTAPQEVDTVFGGCYRRELFDRIGGFDERLVRGQDREFNLRLRKAGGRIIQFPDITVRYYARSRIWPFVKWVFLSATVPVAMSRALRRVLFSWRNLVPPSFLGALILLTGLAVGIGGSARAGPLSLLCLHLVVGIAFSVREARRWRRLALLLLLPPAFLVTHVAYGLGTVWGSLGGGPIRGSTERTDGGGEDSV